MILTQNAKISGVSVCVPNNLVNNLKRLKFKDKKQFINLTGVSEHYIDERNLFKTSDLCLKAAEKIINDLKWKRNEIDFLIFVSQTRDYLLPSTACILQEKLKLKKNVFTLDIPFGCSGYVYGLFNSFLISSNMKGKGLLLCGDMSSKFINMKDEKYFGLFVDAGSATAIEFTKDKKFDTPFSFGADGKGFNNLIYKSDGFNNSTNVFLEMEGPKIFEFAIEEVPKQINDLLKKSKHREKDLNYCILHQANKFLVESILKKTKISNDKNLMSIQKFGNTNSASIPVTILNNKDKVKNSKIIISGFGVGYSWASAIISLEKIKITNLLKL
jgi:3-oxoacyl-[acyl-carrier-protein] synthase-3